MELIDADVLVHIPIYDDQTEETILEEMSIADILDTFADEGCPPAQPEIIYCKNCTKRYSDKCPLLRQPDNGHCHKAERRSDKPQEIRKVDSCEGCSYEEETYLRCMNCKRNKKYYDRYEPKRRTNVQM